MELIDGLSSVSVLFTDTFSMDLGASTLRSLSKRRRVPHCGHLSDHYQMCFPFDDAARDRGYSWFVDKEKQRYMTIGLTPEIDDENYFVKEPNNNKDHDNLSITTELSDSTNSERDSADELANEL